MTGQAFRIIESGFVPHTFVGVMAGEATDARVNFIVAGTVEDAIGLKAYVAETTLLRQEHRLLVVEMA
jgi:hypothetical protein